MENQRTSFVFNTVWYDIIKECPAQVIGEVFAAVMEYALHCTLPEEICNEANVIFQFIKLDIDRREKRRLRAKKAKTPSKISEIPEKAKESEKTVVPEKPEPSVQPEDIVSQYYIKYKAPKPCTFTDARSPREFTEGRIRTLVEMTVRDMIDKGEILPGCPEFFIRLNAVVNRRYETVCKILSKLDYASNLDEERWADIFDKAHWFNRA